MAQEVLGLMKIGFVSHWYDPEVGSASLSGTIARALRTQDDEVRVLTGFPIYPQGQLYPGYRLRPYLGEMVDGVDVRRSIIYPSHDTNPVRRMANYLSFAISGAATALFALRDRDVNLVFCSPATAAVPALVARAVYGIPFVLHVQDLWPDSVLAAGFLPRAIDSPVRTILNAYLSHTYRAASHVAATSPGMAEELVRRGVARSKVSVIPNWADEGAFYPTQAPAGFAAELGLQQPLVVMYAGNLGEVQGLDVLVRAAARLTHRTNVTFAFVGGGVAEQQLRSRAAELGLTNIVFVPPQPFSRMATVLAAGDVQVVSLIDDPLFRMTLPSKLQAVLAAGRPVVAALAGDGAALVAASGAGTTVPPGDDDALARAIEQLLDDPEARRRAGCRGRRYYEAHLSQATSVGSLLARLREAASKR